ncbi:MAG: phosphoribosylformylglycinamidine cyclo-ligase [Burkholderiales bacterium]|jgi:phosphoribosylformylglycinamidine cyclo-ligase|nr:phosphoribosylformylglycinamidine cyclo-ligase [Burkholderiales bacterium]
MQNVITYKDAGVDIDAGDELVRQIVPFAKKTMRPEVIAGIGGFGAMFEIGKRYKHPILVSGTDGVGTKLKLAFELNRHDTIGIDLVAMSVNDILVQGAEPLFFLDYFACGNLNVVTATDVIKGIALGCEQSGCSLIGGETAEMPGMYSGGEYDLAGFAVGVVEKDAVIDGSKIAPGDVILGLGSSGFHSNGYSLVRKLIEASTLDLGSRYDDKLSWADVLLAPTTIYVKPVLELLTQIDIHGMSHITGGGITGNLPRIFPNDMAAEIRLSALPNNRLFSWIKETAHLNDKQMLETFNCGVGYCLIVKTETEAQVRQIMNKYDIPVYNLGEMTLRTNDAVEYI